MINSEVSQLQNSRSNQVDLIAEVKEGLLDFTLEIFIEKTTRLSSEMRVIEGWRAIFI